jgi:hypothetical protein
MHEMFPGGGGSRYESIPRNFGEVVWQLAPPLQVDYQKGTGNHAEKAKQNARTHLRPRSWPNYIVQQYISYSIK